jgi:hypothetical protein
MSAGLLPAVGHYDLWLPLHDIVRDLGIDVPSLRGWCRTATDAAPLAPAAS